MISEVSAKMVLVDIVLLAIPSAIALASSTYAVVASYESAVGTVELTNL